MKLTYEDPESGYAATVEFDRYDGPFRTTWKHAVTCGGMPVTVPGDDLHQPGDRPDPVEALRSLASFLSAWVESWAYQGRTGTPGDNATLFEISPELRENFHGGADEIPGLEEFADELTFRLTKEDA